MPPESKPPDTRALESRYERQTSVLVQCDQFGRMGNASIRYCRREQMKYAVGPQFTAAFGLGDPVRRKILPGVLKRDADE